ncbi:MAG: 4'-phosphopantetheinyl transferase superfamily protein [Acidobacteriota bacterium]|jgi:4'-phosphopantetheinyl transferase|nr:4'-phosphopantetheinyl transferase superfamily protein [Acidobacteriota bacterium]
MFDSIRFLTQNLADVPGGDGWLGVGEREFLAGLRFPKRRDDWRLGRWTAKMLLRGRWGLPPDAALDQIEICAVGEGAAGAGAPEAFFQGGPAGVSISISHAGGRGFCCAAPDAVALGCDIEAVAPRSDAMVADFFTPAEVEAIGRLAAAAPEREALVANLVWSAKESVLKALREGLRRDTRSVVVEVEPFARPDGWNRWRGHCLQTGRIFPGVWTSGDGFVQTIACGEARP